MKNRYFFFTIFLLLFSASGFITANNDKGESNITADCKGYVVDIPDFLDASRINIVGDAFNENGYLRLTPSKVFTAGAFWLKEKAPVTDSFSVEFSFRISNGKHNNTPDGWFYGGDGIAFVIQNESPEALGYLGYGIGYENITSSLAIEFDSFCNCNPNLQEKNDPSGNHIAIQSNGLNANTAMHKEGTTLAVTSSFYEIPPDSSLNYVKIDYGVSKPGTLRIFIDTMPNPTIPVLVLDNLNLMNLLNLKDGKAWIGITGATGNSYQDQDIADFHLCARPARSCTYTPIDYSRFDDIPNLQLVRDAQKVDSVLMMTYAGVNKSGAVWCKEKLPVMDGFISTFSFRMREPNDNNNGDGSTPGADGLAFVVQNSDINQAGIEGGGIAYEGIPNSIAVEFDLYKNDETQIINKFDPNGNHVAVQSRGTEPNSASHLQENMLGMNDSIFTLSSDGTIYYARVEYNIKPKTLSVYLSADTTLMPLVLTVENLDLTSLLDLGLDRKAFIGITSATGNSYQIHEVLSWNACIMEIETGNIDEPATRGFDNIDAYPNPSNALVNISYQLLEDSFVELRIFDMFGREIDKPVEGMQSSGSYRPVWDGSNYPSGVYYYTLCINNKINRGTVVLSK